MAHAEHPLVAPHGTDAAPHLIGQGLDAEAVIGGGQPAGDGVAGAVLFLTGEKHFDRLFEAPLQQMGVGLKGDEPAQIHSRLERQMKTMNGVKKKQGAYPFVKVVTAPAEIFQILALGQQLLQRRAPAKGVERLVARGSVGGGDDVSEFEGHWGRGK